MITRIADFFIAAIAVALGIGIVTVVLAIGTGLVTTP